jgi:hypothetical protein
LPPITTAWPPTSAGSWLLTICGSLMVRLPRLSPAFSKETMVALPMRTASGPVPGDSSMRSTVPVASGASVMFLSDSTQDCMGIGIAFTCMAVHAAVTRKRSPATQAVRTRTQ